MILVHTVVIIISLTTSFEPPQDTFVGPLKLKKNKDYMLVYTGVNREFTVQMMHLSL